MEGTIVELELDILLALEGDLDEECEDEEEGQDEP
jgi:hypothetical protein